MAMMIWTKAAIWTKEAAVLEAREAQPDHEEGAAAPEPREDPQESSRRATTGREVDGIPRMETKSLTLAKQRMWLRPQKNRKENQPVGAKERLPLVALLSSSLRSQILMVVSALTMTVLSPCSRLCRTRVAMTSSAS